MVLPGSMADSIDYLLTYQWNDVQRQDVVVFFCGTRLWQRPA
jgi:putative ABC transport system permease protein